MSTVYGKNLFVTAPKRFQRMLLTIQKFDFNVICIPGIEVHMSDALSRAYLPYQKSMRLCKNIEFAVDTRSIAEIETMEINAVRTVNVSSRSIKKL